jgi:hypothetical protein
VRLWKHLKAKALSNSAVIPFSATAAVSAANGGYEAVRFNAMKHGILSEAGGAGA